MRWLLFPLSLLLACVAAGPVHAFVCSNPPANEGDEYYNQSYHTMQFCNGSQWIPEGVPGGGNFRPPMGTTAQEPACNSGMEGGVWYNTDISNLQVCDGTAWHLITITSSSCGSPSGLSFTDITGAPLGTLETSAAATITFSGCSSALSVSVTGGGSPQISVNGGAWTTAGSIYSGQTLQVRLTSSGSVSTQLTAVVTVASTSTNWHVTTRSGALQIFSTANTYASSFGGLSAADSICQSEAGAAGYGGTYKAVLSDGSTDAKARLTLSYPIINAYNGLTVSASNFWNGTISNAITSPSGASGSYWTGTNVDGTKNTSTCANWSTASSGTTIWGQG